MDTSKSTERKDFEWAVKLQRTSLEIIGLWPKIEHRRRKLFADFMVLLEFTLVCFGCTIPAFHAMIINSNDIQAVVDNLQFLLPVLMTLLKLVVLSYKRKSLVPVIDMIADDWSKPKPNSEQIVMIKRSQIARTISACTYSLILFCYLMLTILPGFGITFRYLANTTDMGRILPMQSYYLFDVTTSPNYELTFAVQCVGTGIVSICTTAVDNFLGLLVFHISGQMENLRVRFSHMIDAKDFDKALAFNVQDHIRLIRSVDIVESTFTILLLALVLFFGIFFCIYGTLLITIFNRGTGLSMLRMAYLSTVLLTIFLHMCVCFIVGEILVSHSERIYDTLCECEWEKLEPRKARNMIILMIRTKKPLYITAGKVAPITTPTFCSIIKMSASYISFLITRI